MDTRGWASKNVSAEEANNYRPDQISQSDRLVAPQVTAQPAMADAGGYSLPGDVYDTTNPVSTSFNQMSKASSDQARQSAIAGMQQYQTSTPAARPPQSFVQEFDDDYKTYDPSPITNDNAQSQVASNDDDLDDEGVQKTETETMTKDQSGAILNLANNSDLNISTIAREAEKALKSDDVIQLH